MINIVVGICLCTPKKRFLKTSDYSRQDSCYMKKKKWGLGITIIISIMGCSKEFILYCTLITVVDSRYKRISK